LEGQNRQKAKRKNKKKERKPVTEKGELKGDPRCDHSGPIMTEEGLHKACAARGGERDVITDKTNVAHITQKKGALWRPTAGRHSLE